MAKYKPQARGYQKRARAEQEALTKQRITEAVAELHQSVGPALTTISDVADLAGVGRVTVYKHFPTDTEMFRACGEHWIADNPPPDFSASLAIADHAQRCAAVLDLLYPYYRQAYGMMGKVLRDAQLMPSLAQVVEEGWTNMIRKLEDALMVKKLSVAKAKRLRASLRVILDLNTWQALTESGLSDKQAATLASSWPAY